MPVRRLALAALVVVVIGRPAQAQQEARPTDRRPVALLAMRGPPEPAAFARAVGLDADQTAKYTNLRNAYLDATRAERDSLTAMRNRMRAAREVPQSGPRPDAAGPAGAAPAGGARRGRGGMQAMRPVVDTLEVRFADFEADLAFLLTAAQQRKYEAWKEAETARVRSELMNRQR